MKFSKIKLQMVQEENFEYNNKTIKSTTDVIKIINEFEELEKAPEEHILLICLDCKNQVLAYTELAKGSINSCSIDFKSIFKTVLMCNASRFILAHNHPTTIAEVSKRDKEVTERLKQASKIMDIEFLDHIVIGGNSFVSCIYQQNKNV